jgi:hypothetical protein
MMHYKERSDFMGRTNTSSRQKKKAQNQANAPKVPPAPIPVFDYNQFRDAIVEANRTIQEEEKIANHKALEEDHMTKLLIELLNILFTFAMAMLGIFALASVVLSFMDAFASESSVDKIICIGCWLVFIAGFLTLPLVRHLKNQGRISRKFWFNFIVYAILALTMGSVAFAFFANQLLFFTMSFTVVLAIMFSFCYLAMQSLKRENDRAYLVSYFSAITGIAALVVSAITLVVTIF